MLLLMVERRIFLGNDLNGLSVLSSTLQTSILGTCAALSTVAATSWWPATRCDPAGPMRSVGLIVLTYFAVRGVCSQVRHA